MIRIIVFLLGIALSPYAGAGEVDGLVKKESPYGVSETLDRLENVLKGKGFTIALRWDHGGRATGVDVPLRETELLVFGNPKVGSHLMTSAQSAAIDLPMKALAWRDEQGKVWLGYNAPAYIAGRHGIEDRAEVIGKMTNALDKLTDAALAGD